LGLSLAFLHSELQIILDISKYLLDGILSFYFGGDLALTLGNSCHTLITQPLILDQHGWEPRTSIPMDERVSKISAKQFWTEDRTSSTGVSSLSRSCVISLVGGTAGFIISKNPLPFLMGLSACFPKVLAQQKIGGEFQVNTYTSLDQQYSTIATLNNGNFVVAWQSNGQDGDGDGVYGQIFDRNATKVGNEFKINSYVTYSQRYPSTTDLKSNNFAVTWSSDGNDGDGFGIFGQLFDNNGLKIGNEFQINTYTTSYQVWPSISALPNTNFVVNWDSIGEDGSSSGVYGQLLGGTGAKVGIEFQINTFVNASQQSSSVASLFDGRFLVSWMSHQQDGDGWGVYGQLFEENGTRIGNEFQVNAYSILDQWSPSVARLSNSSFVISWASDGQDGDSWGIYAQAFNEIGEKIGNEFLVNSHTISAQQTPSVESLDNDHFVVVWQSLDQLRSAECSEMPDPRPQTRDTPTCRAWR